MSGPGSAGVVYLGGGGSAQDEADLWQEMLTGCRRLLYWPFALDGAMLDGADGWLRTELADRGPHIRIDTWVGLAGHRPDELADVDLVFVGGGNTFRLAHEVQRHGFSEPVRRWVQHGGHYYGGSAGAILAADSIGPAATLDRNDVGLKDCRGLGLVKGFAVLPHFTVDQLTSVQAMSRRLHSPILAVPEAGGAIIDSGGITTVGPEPLWTITATSAIMHPVGARLTP